MLIFFVKIVFTNLNLSSKAWPDYPQKDMITQSNTGILHHYPKVPKTRFLEAANPRFGCRLGKIGFIILGARFMYYVDSLRIVK